MQIDNVLIDRFTNVGGNPLAEPRDPIEAREGANACRTATTKKPMMAVLSDSVDPSTKPRSTISRTYWTRPRVSAAVNTNATEAITI